MMVCMTKYIIRFTEWVTGSVSSNPYCYVFEAGSHLISLFTPGKHLILKSFQGILETAESCLTGPETFLTSTSQARHLTKNSSAVASYFKVHLISHKAKLKWALCKNFHVMTRDILPGKSKGCDFYARSRKPLFCSMTQIKLMLIQSTGQCWNGYSVL